MQIKNWIASQFKFTIREISFAGIFVGLYTLFNMSFMKINFGVMQAGIEYVWLILMGLTNRKLFIAILSAIVADTLSTVINGIGMWAWQYAIIAPSVALIAFVFKYYLRLKNNYLWWSLNIFVSILIALSPFILIFVYNHNEAKYKSITIDSDVTKAIIWAMMSLLAVSIVSLNVWYIIKKTENTRKIISIVIMISIIIIVSIWIWGPIAYMVYANRIGSSIKSYDVYLVPRILKTPIILPLYSLITIPIYKAWETIDKKETSHRW